MEQRKKYTLEYLLKANPKLIKRFLIEPDGLSSWFAQNVNINGNVFEFVWEGSSERGELMTKGFVKETKFKWIDRPTEEFMVFRVEKENLGTGSVLIIEDYDEANQLEEAEMAWDAAVDKLKSMIGG